MISLFSERLKSISGMPINVDIENVNPFSESAYLVQSDKDDTVLIAIKPSIRARYISWFDGTRDRMFRVASLNQIENLLALSSDEANYFFLPLTYSLYEEFVKPRLISAPPIHSQEELTQYISKNHS